MKITQDADAVRFEIDHGIANGNRMYEAWMLNDAQAAKHEGMFDADIEALPKAEKDALRARIVAEKLKAAR